MSIAVPDAVVADYDHLVDGLELPDRDDRHVLAVAVASGADNLVTANLADFPARAIPAGLIVLSPDDFVLMLIRADLDAVATVIDDQTAALRRPPMSTAELLDGLEVVGLRKSVDAVRRPMP